MIACRYSSCKPVMLLLMNINKNTKPDYNVLTFREHCSSDILYIKCLDLHMSVVEIYFIENNVALL